MASTLKRQPVDGNDSAKKKHRPIEKLKKGISSPALDSSLSNGSLSDPSSDDSIFPLDVEPSSGLKQSTIFTSSLNEVEHSSGRKNRSLRKVSVNASPLIPLNNDCNELVEEETVDNKPEEKSVNKSSGQEEPDQELSIIKSMSLDEMQEHVKRCIQLSSENKINTKNAFALKLIDCMSIISKNDNENNFAAMACQLDAGAKIYSLRVDAVHHQVMKLLETCMLAETRTKKKKGNNDLDSEEEVEGKDSANTKDKLKKRKKKMLANSEQITRQAKQTDPREQFVRLEALPGDILDKAKRDCKDLSLTLDRHTPYWMNYGTPPSHATGQDEIPHIVLKSRRIGPDLDLESKSDMSTLPKIEPIEIQDISQDIDNDWDDGGTFDDNEQKIESEEYLEKECKQKDPEMKCDVEMVTLATSRMTENGSNNTISRVDVMKALFHKEGESEYHYLKMENSFYWAGPAYWKRHQGVKDQENKKKTVRKKKDPLEIKYSEELGKIFLTITGKQKNGNLVKRNTKLSKRTLMKWSKKKVTCPVDIHFNPQSLITLYRAEIVMSGAGQNQPEDNPPIGPAPSQGEDDDDMGDDNAADDLDIGPANMDESAGSESHNDSGPAAVEPEPEPEPDHDMSSQQADNALSIPSDACSDSGTAPFAGFDVPGPSGVNEEAKMDSTCDAYDGDNLVPMVKMVKVNPIRCVIRPQRIDMSHLKAVMLDIILTSIAESEEELRSSGETRRHGHIMLRDLYQRLRTSNQLLSPTCDDLTFQMTFFCLLTLTNENDFFLKNEQNGDVIIKKHADEEDLCEASAASIPMQ